MFATREACRTPGRETTMEKNLYTKEVAQLCRLAFDHQAQIPPNVQAVFDQTVVVLCCLPQNYFWTDCFVDSPLHVEDECLPSHPIIIFNNRCKDNETLLKCIERGECMCKYPERDIVIFLPACAAAAAGNLNLCRTLLRSFYRSDNYRVIQQNISILGQERMQLLFEQVVHHLIYFGHGEEALRILEDPEISETKSISDEGKLSFMNSALKGGHRDIFRLLVDRFGVNIEGRRYGPSPLYMAVKEGMVQMAREILQKGADRKQLHSIFWMALGRPYARDSDEMAVMLLEEGLDQSYLQDPREPTPLQSAVMLEHYTILDYLLEKGQVTVPMHIPSSDKTEETVWVPLVAWCCYYLEQDMARYLVQKGLDCKSPIPLPLRFKFNKARTPLQLIAENDMTEADQKLMDLLIEHGADVNEITPDGDTPLDLAMKVDNIDTVKTLLKAGAILDSPKLTDTESDISQDRKEGKYSFLWYAIEYEKYNMAEMALAAGYRARREPWFVKGDFPQNTPKDVIEKLKRQSLQPLSLKCLSRRALKKSVGSSLLTFLSQDDLGPIYNDDILLKDLVKMYKIK